MKFLQSAVRGFVTLLLAIGLVACASTTKQASTGEMLDDAAITAKVKAALVRDPQTSAMQVNVDTFKGAVSLSGFVDSSQERQRAEQIARSVAGVGTVQNKLLVKGQGAAGPEAR